MIDTKNDGTGVVLTAENPLEKPGREIVGANEGKVLIKDSSVNHELFTSIDYGSTIVAIKGTLKDDRTFGILTNYSPNSTFKQVDKLEKLAKIIKEAGEISEASFTVYLPGEEVNEGIIPIDNRIATYLEKVFKANYHKEAVPDVKPYKEVVSINPEFKRTTNKNTLLNKNIPSNTRSVSVDLNKDIQSGNSTIGNF